MLFNKEEESPDEFWRKYEEKTGEKILARGLGKYVCGWDEFDQKRWNGLWGLIINTSGGFRFHHFPQNSVFDALFQFSSTSREPPKEKTIFLPQEKIISQNTYKEENWWKKLFYGSTPQLVINYRDEMRDESCGKDKKLVFEAEYIGE